MKNTQRSRNDRNRRGPARRPAPVDIWRDAGPLPDVEAITVAGDTTALLRSLGDPPMNVGATAAHYFATVVERAAAIATALALSAELLAEPAED